ncbi:MAG TPA: type IX secretion system outer membrane channel protein PorV [Bacteroidia bacterium]|nr:type IX secretion system outer membrane channel protein PorV [Bacteroidia bacterium]
MNITIKKSAALFFSILATFNLSNAQDDKSNLLGQINTITTAVPFLMISPDARAGGMGDAGVASSPDANSIAWNPAKLAFMEKNFGFSLSYTPWLRQLVNDINLSYLSGYIKLKKDQTLGASLRYFSLGNIDFTDNAGNSLGSFNPSEFSFDAAYARKLSDNFSGGIALRYIHSNLTGGILVDNNASKAGNSVAADISVYFQKPVTVSKKDATFALGLAITNIGSKISYTETGDKDFIPINLRLGPSLKIKLNDYNELAFLLDINKLLVPTPPIYSDSTDKITGEQAILFGKPSDVSVPSGIFQSFSDAPGGFKEELKEYNLCGGMEYWYDKQFAFRAGYFFEAATKGNRKYFTLGAGVRYSVFGLDFAYLIPTEQRNPLENTLRFTLSFDFSSSKGDSSDKEETTE